MGSGDLLEFPAQLSFLIMDILKELILMRKKEVGLFIRRCKVRILAKMKLFKALDPCLLGSIFNFKLNIIISLL